MPRYFNEDGTINWVFVNRAACGLVRDATEAERELGIVFNLGGKAAVIKLLARRGELEIVEEDVSLADAYRQHCQERRLLHSLWARGRRTATARV